MNIISLEGPWWTQSLNRALRANPADQPVDLFSLDRYAGLKIEERLEGRAEGRLAAMDAMGVDMRVLSVRRRHRACRRAMPSRSPANSTTRRSPRHSPTDLGGARRWLEEANLSNDDKRLIAHRNAERILRLRAR
ncbi:hypothetical protein ACIRVK_36350 [Streptomyces sp. NPDC101152]|uniref:hypothetical protein n=1 Tax=Streptomyces sp. NPDC101152 TaxID=3366116 RepID=UPI00382450CB